MVGTKTENEARDWRDDSAGKVLASKSESPEPIPQERHNTYKLSLPSPSKGIVKGNKVSSK